MRVELKGKLKFSKVLNSGTYTAQISEPKKVGDNWEYANYSLMSKEINLTDFEEMKVEVKATLFKSEIYKEKVQLTFWVNEIKESIKVEVTEKDNDPLPF
jgi:hypothetical protein